MKKNFYLLSAVAFVLFACSNKTQTLEIVPGITSAIPLKTRVEKTSPEQNPVTWEASFGDDSYKIYCYTIFISDSLSQYIGKQSFVKNIESFLQTFEPTNVDSTYSVNGSNHQNDLSFDYKHNENRYRLYVKFLGTKNNFIAVCYHTPFPVDSYSRRIKDKLFGGIIIK